MSDCDVKYTYVDSEDKLKTVCIEIESEKTLAIDLECENNLHHYGAYISLIQISTSGKRNFIIDVIALKTLGELKSIFENPDIQKIFHDISFDVRILKHEFHCSPKNIFDSELAAVFLSKPDIGLGSLLEHYFDFEKKKKFQMADWTMRPLTKDMLCYAIQDTHYLIRLKNQLIKELKDKDLYSWFKEELKYLEEKELNHKEPEFSDIKGYSRLSNEQKTILKHLHSLREEIAKKADMPPHFIMNNRKLVEISCKPPKQLSNWQNMKAVHPAVKRMANKFFSTVKRCQEHVEDLPNPKPKRYNQKQRDYFAKLNRIRDSLALQTGLRGHLIMNKDQMQDIVLSDKLNSLRSWQKKLVEELL